MSELIKRQDVIDAVAKAYRYESDRMTALQEIPVVTEQEIRNKTIDDFVKRLKADTMAKTFGLRICDIDRIAEEMRGAE